MSQDDLNNNAAGGPESHAGAAGALPDDGLIHEWLDGQLDEAASARLESLVKSSPAFAERVAEARGLVAAASRILLSLDRVPGAVLPVARGAEGVDSAAGVGADSDDVAASSRRGDVVDISRASVTSVGAQTRAANVANPSTRGRRWARWGSIAAVLMVGVTSVLVARREPPSAVVASSASAELDAPSAAAPSAAAPAASPLAEAPSAVVASSDAAAAEAPDTPGEPASAATREALRSAMQSAAVASAKAAPAREAREVRSPELLPSPVLSNAERVAADPLLRPRIAAVADSPPRLRSDMVSRAAAPATAAASAPAIARRGALGLAAGAAATSEANVPEFTPIQSDIARGELELAVQYVICRPGCVQTRLEIAADGRMRRWVQTIGGGAPADTGRVSASELSTLRALVDSLDLSSLPAMVRLDGRRCTTVGSLRESIRVEFRHEGAMRSVMGLPWCSDGTHPLDRVSNAAQALATQHLGAASRR